jgi:hypothetical protein
MNAKAAYTVEEWLFEAQIARWEQLHYFYADWQVEASVYQEFLACCTPRYQFTGMHRDSKELEFGSTLLKDFDGVPSDLRIHTTKPNSVSIYIYAGSHKNIEKLVAKLKEVLPELPEEHSRPSVEFINWNPKTELSSTSRRLEVPSWIDIEANYHDDVIEAMRSLHDIRSFDDFNGRLMIWRGAPGVGKTYTVRALLQEWQGWMNFAYITDPEVLFGDSRYMMRCLLNFAESSKPTLLILEDAGEMLAPDAKHHNHQGVARFLNLIDGMIGQGSKIVILVTTNEELKNLHPAIIRDGRCHAIVEFPPLSQESANTWLQLHGSDARVEEAAPLSELYSLLNSGKTNQIKEKAFGFAK